MLKYSTYQSIYNKPSRQERNEGLHTLLFHKGLAKLVVSLVVLCITCTGMVTAFASSSEDGNRTLQNSIVVMPGDTLWKIASEHKPKGKDTRIYIEKIMTMNNLSSSAIEAGDTLNLPGK